MDASTKLRRPLRLRNYDYSQAGAYFVTICIHDRGCLLGEIVDNKMHLNDAGQCAAEAWQWLAAQYLYVMLDEFIIMPNHLMGLWSSMIRRAVREWLLQRSNP